MQVLIMLQIVLEIMEERFSNIVLFIVVLVFFSSCTRNDKIARFLQNEDIFSESDTLVVNLTDIIGVEWDRMQVINEWRPAWSISEDIGFEYTGRGTTPHSRLFIFIKSDQIVYKERMTWGRNAQRRNFVFRHPTFSTRRFYNVPYLVIRKIQDNGEFHFVLTPIQVEQIDFNENGQE